MKSMEATIKKMIEKIDSGFWKSEHYETGKQDVEFMSQNALPLFVLQYENYNVEITVNGDCRFDYNDTTYRYEDDLDDEIISLLRTGKIDLDNNNWFEFFYEGGESFSVGEVDTLPSPGKMKQEFIDDIIQQMEENRDSQAALLNGFDFVGVTFKQGTRLNEKQFNEAVQNIFSHEDLFNVVHLFEPEFIDDKYGDSHYGISFYTQNEKANEHIRKEFMKLF